jgi:hypothetical protein
MRGFKRHDKNTDIERRLNRMIDQIVTDPAEDINDFETINFNSFNHFFIPKKEILPVNQNSNKLIQIEDFQQAELNQCTVDNEKINKLEQNDYVLNEIENVGKLNAIKNFKDDEKWNFYELLKGNFIKLAKRKNGSKFLQTFCKYDQSINSKIFNELFFDIPGLMTDVYANYFIQEFYGFLKLEDKIKFLSQVRNHIITISNNNIGTFCIQHIIDNFTFEKEQFIIIDSFSKPSVLLRISNNYFGVQVVGKLISKFEEKSIQFIYDYIIQNFKELSLNSTGLVLIKKVIQHFKELNYAKMLISLIKKHFDDLIQHPIGNNVIQTAFDVRKVNIGLAI